MFHGSVSLHTFCNKNEICHKRKQTPVRFEALILIFILLGQICADARLIALFLSSKGAKYKRWNFINEIISWFSQHFLVLIVLGYFFCMHDNKMGLPLHVHEVTTSVFSFTCKDTKFLNSFCRSKSFYKATLIKALINNTIYPNKIPSYKIFQNNNVTNVANTVTNTIKLLNLHQSFFFFKF